MSVKGVEIDPFKPFDFEGVGETSPKLFRVNPLKSFGYLAKILLISRDSLASYRQVKYPP